MAITKKGTELFYQVYEHIDVDYSQWDDIKEVLSLLSRHAVTHRKLAEYACNGDPIRTKSGGESVWADNQLFSIARQREKAAEKRNDNIEARIIELAKRLPNVTLELQGDPRGCTVRLIAGNRTYCLN